MEETAGERRRIFCALTFTDEERELLAGVRDQVMAGLAKGSPSRTENLHLTLAFLGMLDAEEEEKAEAALRAAAASSGPVTIMLGNLGSFGSRRHASVVWRGIASSQGLMELQSRLVSELKERGLGMEDRPYRPHITLVRGAKAYPEEDLDAVLAGLSSGMEPAEAHFSSASVMWSHHPAGELLTYTPLATEALRVS